MQNRTFGSHLMANNRIFISVMLVKKNVNPQFLGKLVQKWRFDQKNHLSFFFNRTKLSPKPRTQESTGATPHVVRFIGRRGNAAVQRWAQAVRWVRGPYLTHRTISPKPYDVMTEIQLTICRAAHAPARQTQCTHANGEPWSLCPTLADTAKCIWQRAQAPRPVSRTREALQPQQRLGTVGSDWKGR
jgi:hypothetical protein